MTAIIVESAVDASGSCRAAVKARSAVVCFFRVATIPADELCIFERPAIPMDVMTPGSGLHADPEMD